MYAPAHFVRIVSARRKGSVLVLWTHQQLGVAVVVEHTRHSTELLWSCEVASLWANSKKSGLSDGVPQ